MRVCRTNSCLALQQSGNISGNREAMYARHHALRYGRTVNEQSMVLTYTFSSIDDHSKVYIQHSTCTFIKHSYSLQSSTSPPGGKKDVSAIEPMLLSQMLRIRQNSV